MKAPAIGTHSLCDDGVHLSVVQQVWFSSQTTHVTALVGKGMQAVPVPVDHEQLYVSPGSPPTTQSVLPLFSIWNAGKLFTCTWVLQTAVHPCFVT